MAEGRIAMYQMTDDQKLFVEQVRKMVCDKVAPRSAEIDRTGQFPWDLKESYQDILDFRTLRFLDWDHLCGRKQREK